uniref:Oxysterol-binding protein n=1 Tax=Clytia hemisphaerica TaxID=252671 RepID=A0A7M6DRP8_9CNID
KELSKIPMPVNFSEPLSMTQRLTEELEYSELLDKAATCQTSIEQICYIAAFSISCYASTAIRTGKPFNPLLGETYELDRTNDKGWTSLAEQVSHHPPSLAHHAEGRGWTLWQNFTMSSKFRGKYLLVTPLGTAHCKFAKTGDHYTWKKVTTTVNNIIVGKLWIDQVTA